MHAESSSLAKKLDILMNGAGVGGLTSFFWFSSHLSEGVNNDTEDNVQVNNIDDDEESKIEKGLSNDFTSLAGVSRLPDHICIVSWSCERVNSMTISNSSSVSKSEVQIVDHATEHVWANVDVVSTLALYFEASWEVIGVYDWETPDCEYRE